jgi:PIN domain nuclease of toxin-antitoxin system
VKYLLDTHIILWAAAGTLPVKAEDIIRDETNELYFSAASIWEISIKQSLSRPDFTFTSAAVLNGLVSAGYAELPIVSKHTTTLGLLPDHHKDPFDRILIAQAISEGLFLLTNDKIIGRYGDQIILV